MAIKFYRAKALPSSLNSSHDGVWFIKPDGATSFRTYNVKDGVAVGDGFDPNADYLQGKYQSGLYSTLRGQYEDYGFKGIYDRTVTTDADLRGGGVNIDIIEGSCNYAQDPNILIDANATGSGLLLTDCTPDLKIDVIIDNGSQASAHGHALWQAFFQNRRASEQYAYFSSIKVYVSLDGSSWSTVPNDGWSVDDFNPRVAAYGPAGFWFSRSGTPSPEWRWRYVKFEFRNIVFGTHSTNPDRSYFKALGIRHASEQYARQYLTERRAKGLFDEKVDKTDSRLNDSREWTASTVSQSEAQAGTSTTRRAWTALRVRQAITAWWDTIADKIAEKAWVSANFDKYGFWNLKTNGIQRKTIQSGNDVDFVAGNNMKVSYGAGGVVVFSAQDTTLNNAILADNEISHDATVDIVNNHQLEFRRNTVDGQSVMGLGGNGLNFGIGLNVYQTGDIHSGVYVRKNHLSFRNLNGYGVGISTNTGYVIYHAYLRTDNLTEKNQTFQFPNKSGTIALEEDIDDKIDAYFETNPISISENLTYPLVVVVDDSCFILTNNARYLFTGSASEVCILAEPDDEGKEILILNDTGASLTPSSSGSPMRILTSILGGLSMPAGYKGRFRVIDGELVEIG